MNINKIIAGVIFAFVLFFPFRVLFFGDEIYSGARHLFLFLSIVVGYYAAFAIATNEPFGRNEKAVDEKHELEEHEYEQEHRTAA